MNNTCVHVYNYYTVTIMAILLYGIWISFIYIVHVVTLLVSQSLHNLEGPQYATVLEYLDEKSTPMKSICHPSTLDM